MHLFPDSKFPSCFVFRFLPSSVLLLLAFSLPAHHQRALEFDLQKQPAESSDCSHPGSLWQLANIGGTWSGGVGGWHFSQWIS